MPASSGEEPRVGSRVHVQAGGEEEEVVGTVTSVAHGWFTVELPGRAQPRKCRRGEVRLLSGSERAVVATLPGASAAAAARSDDDDDDDDEEEEEEDEEEKEEEEEEEEEEAIIRLDAPTGALGRKPQPVTQLQRDAARLASVRLETGLPKPSYLRFDKLGSGHAKKASLDAKATRALAAPPQQALLAPVKRTEKGAKNARQTQATHRDKEAEQDAKMVLMRNYVDPKRFYKSLDSLTPGFQIGTVIEGRMETGPQGRLSRKQRKRTFVDEILADRAVRKYSKRKFSEIQQAAQSGRKGWQKKQQRKHTLKWAR